MKKLVKQFSKYVDPTLCFLEIIVAYSEYLRITEVEQITRDKIRAWEQTNLGAIQSRRDVIINFLNHSFDERAKNFDELFKRIDVAMSNKDNDQLSILLGSVIELLKINPYSNLKDFQIQFDDPNHVWEF